MFIDKHRPRFLLDENTDPPAEPPTENDPTPETGDDQEKNGKGEKTFKQADIDAAVKSRLTAEKAKAQRAIEAKDAEIASLEGELNGLRTHFAAQLEARLADMDEGMADLVKKLDTADQIEWLAKNPATAKATTPVTPRGNKDDKPAERPKIRTGI